MKMKVEKRADTVADRLHKDMAEVKDQVITERTEQMEEQAAGQQAENDRLSAELAEMTKQFETVRDEVNPQLACSPLPLHPPSWLFVV